MSKLYPNLITTTAGFNLPAQTPIDDRFVVAVYADLADFVSNNIAYEGLQVYVKADKKVYIYQGDGVWVEQGGKDFETATTADIKSLFNGGSIIATNEDIISLFN